MGKSTILRFAEKPKKVVVGNQNYYGLEFIENDVAIQPLGTVGTNLFVYTERHTYGFLLTPGERYDDLVFVRWKFPKSNQPKESPTPAAKVSFPKTTFMLGDSLKVSIQKVKGPSILGLHIVDCSIENIGASDQDISGFELHARQGQTIPENQRTVVDMEKLKPKEKARARIITMVDTKSDLLIEGKLKSRSGKISISRKML